MPDSPSTATAKDPARRRFPRLPGQGAPSRAGAAPGTTPGKLPQSAPSARRSPESRYRLWMLGLGLATAAAVVLFMTWDLQGNASYALTLRGTRLGAMALCAVAVSVATLAFQTVTSNRILTPSIMGMDALYALLQTLMVFSLGATAWTTAPGELRFLVELALMVGFSLLLYRWMFTGKPGSLHLMLLVGIVLGTLFRGISALLGKLIEPSEYTRLQDLFFASFNRVDPGLLGLAAVIVAICVVIALRLRHTLDVMALGRDTAVGLGVDHRRVTTVVLVLCAVLVGTSTALVGPITFFGLLVVSLAYQLAPGVGHGRLVALSSLLGVLTLVAGQFIVEQLSGNSTTLSVIVEFVGGIVFILMLLRGALK